MERANCRQFQTHSADKTCRLICRFKEHINLNNKFQSVRKWNLSEAARQNHTWQNSNNLQGQKTGSFPFRRKILISTPCSSSILKEQKIYPFFIGKELSDKTNIIGKYDRRVLSRIA